MKKTAARKSVTQVDRHDPSRRYHDRVARQYDSIYDDPYWRFHDELTWRLIRPHLPSDAAAQCADLGCGTGKWGLRLLKSGFATTFVDHSGAMLQQAREKAELLGAKARRATFIHSDIVRMPQLPADTFSLVLAMGDPLSICSDAAAAVREMHRITIPGGVVIATAHNKLAALDHYCRGGDLDELEQFIRTGATHWLTDDRREQFPLTTFTPLSLRKLFEQAGFEVLSLIGKPIVPVRRYPSLLTVADAESRLIRIEQELNEDASAAAAAAHLQITARRRPLLETARAITSV